MLKFVINLHTFLIAFQNYYMEAWISSTQVK